MSEWLKNQLWLSLLAVADGVLAGIMFVVHEHIRRRRCSVLRVSARADLLFVAVSAVVVVSLWLVGTDGSFSFFCVLWMWCGFGCSCALLRRRMLRHRSVSFHRRARQKTALRRSAVPPPSSPLRSQLLILRLLHYCDRQRQHCLLRRQQRRQKRSRRRQQTMQETSAEIDLQPTAGGEKDTV